jgi:hypothetical protein
MADRLIHLDEMAQTLIVSFVKLLGGRQPGLDGVKGRLGAIL